MGGGLGFRVQGVGFRQPSGKNVRNTPVIYADVLLGQVQSSGPDHERGNLALQLVLLPRLGVGEGNAALDRVPQLICPSIWFCLHPPCCVCVCFCCCMFDFFLAQVCEDLLRPWAVLLQQCWTSSALCWVGLRSCERVTSSQIPILPPCSSSVKPASLAVGVP